MLQILILAAVAAFLFWRLSIVLGIRTGFEKTVDVKMQIKEKQTNKTANDTPNELSDDDISDYVDISSDQGRQLKIIKSYDPQFSVQSFISGSKSAYELILMAYEKGDLETLENHLAEDVYLDFKAVVTDRANKGFLVEATFIGLREIRIRDVFFEEKKGVAEITVFFKCDLTSVVKDSEENIIEGSSSKVKTHTDLWTFSRLMGTDDPAWQLIATGEEK